MKILALDIGGTSIKSALFDNDCIIRSGETPSNGNLGKDSMLQCIHQCISEYDTYDYLGISTTGQVDAVNGVIIGACDNVPGYAGTELKKLLEDAYHVPVFIENDVNAAALGEAYYGSCTDQKDFICLTYGTGVGGAIVIDRKLYRGSLGIAGEMGHIPTHPSGLLCTCRNRGCYERYASTTALIHKVREVYPDLMDGRSIFSKAQADDPKLDSLIEDWLTEIVHGLVIITHIFNPSLIVLGGGIMDQSSFLPKLQSKLHHQVMDQFKNVTLRRASLGNQAGIYGMLATIKNTLKSETTSKEN